ncbi:MAG: metallophosphoesterase [Planctomycetaceae bacterium]|nr:metallophosphoesterase [Planctomycetaceae bacterium]
MNILVFSDTHGRIPLMLRIVWQWQKENNSKVDCILVTGDLGVWPDLNRLDSSTRKYCQREPAELSFLCFDSYWDVNNTTHELYPKEEINRAGQLLNAILPEINAPILFVGGNHEDYDYLQSCRELNSRPEEGQLEKVLGPTGPHCISVETSGRIWWLIPEKVVSARGLTIAGLSGIDAAADGRDPNRYHPLAVLTEDSLCSAGIRIADSLSEDSLDVLLTHDGLPNAVKTGKGSLGLAEATRAINPRYHFFGHYHRSIEPRDYASMESEEDQSESSKWRTTAVHINKLAFRKNDDFLRDRVLANIEYQDGTTKVHFVEEDWLFQLNRNNWWKIRRD